MAYRHLEGGRLLGMEEDLKSGPESGSGKKQSSGTSGMVSSFSRFVH